MAAQQRNLVNYTALKLRGEDHGCPYCGIFEVTLTFVRRHLANCPVRRNGPPPVFAGQTTLVRRRVMFDPDGKVFERFLHRSFYVCALCCAFEDRFNVNHQCRP